MESHKDSATVAYEGTRGDQPGPVPAGCGNVRVLEQAVGALPQGVKQLYLRADSARSETAWQVEREEPDAIRA